MRLAISYQSVLNNQLLWTSNLFIIFNSKYSILCNLKIVEFKNYKKNWNENFPVSSLQNQVYNHSIFCAVFHVSMTFLGFQASKGSMVVSVHSISVRLKEMFECDLAAPFWKPTSASKFFRKFVKVAFELDS